MSENDREPPDRPSAESDWDDGLRAAFGDAVIEGPPSVLERIEERIGRISRVFLSDAHSDTFSDADQPILNPSTEASLKEGGRYQMLGEIARGGVGIVLQGRDSNLGRDVAVKVLRGRHQNNAELVQRFVEEAQIGGQLQHPGIVPVYDLGVDGARRPFFTMKLVRGRTLAALLSERKTPTEERGRLLGIFSTVCQTMAYAHSRGVIHRDLKPANVMVGAFGEVQVMDWGFAKVLSRGGVEDERRASMPSPTSVDDDVATVRSGPEGTQSFAGSVYGTPAYMSPEQANGGVETLDERADVFSLGAILCEILTGQPPYTARAGVDVLEDAAAARLGGAVERIEASGADGDLIDLAERCLAPESKDRPRHAGAVSEVVSAYRASTEARATEARVEAAEARVRVAEERKAKRLTIALAVVVSSMLVLAGGAWYWIDRSERQARDRMTGAVDRSLREVETAMADSIWKKASLSLEQAKALLASGPADAALETRVAAVHKLYAQSIRAAELDDRLRDIRFLTDNDSEAVDATYRAAFADVNLDLAGDLSRAFKVGEKFDEASRRSIATALDDWAIRRLSRDPAATVQSADATRAESEIPIARLQRVAAALDPDPWRGQLRKAAVSRDRAGLLDLSEGAEGQPAESIDLLAVSLAAAGERDTAIAVLESGYREHPDSFWINVHLSRYYREGEEDRTAEALRHAMIAQSLKPESAAARLEMAVIHALLGEQEQAAAYLAQAQALDQQGEEAWTQLMTTARLKGRRFASTRRRIREVEAALRFERRGSRPPPGRRRRLDPDALSELRRIAKASPDDPFAQVELGQALLTASDFAGAVRCLERACELDVDLGVARAHLVSARYELGQYQKALDELSAAVALDFTSRRFRGLRDRILADAELAAGLAKGEVIVPSLDTARIHRHAGRFVSATRDYRAVLAGTPPWSPRYTDVTVEGICCAVLAGTGHGVEGAALSAEEQRSLRRQAYELMAQGLDTLPVAKTRPIARLYARRRFANCRLDTRLDPVRAPESTTLSDVEKAAWRKLWARIDRALQPV